MPDSKACQLSFTDGYESNRGFLSFQCLDEEVIRVYHHKYGAHRVDKTWMFIEPKIGNNLIEKYLLRTSELTAEEKKLLETRN